MVEDTDNDSTTSVHYLFILLKIIVIATLYNPTNCASAFENGYFLALNRSKISSTAEYTSNNYHPYSRSLFPPVPTTTTTPTTRLGVAELSCYHRYRRKQHAITSKTITNLPSSSSSNIDFQSDTTLYGRGEQHLSAIINEEDVVVYQTGSWKVDGVTVGDEDEDSPPMMKYCKVDTLQIIWTHNCEHGFIRGISIEIVSGKDDGNSNDNSGGTSEGGEDSNNSCSIVSCRNTPNDDLNFVEFGPEQLIARLPVEWLDKDRERGYLALPLPKELM